MRPESHLLAAPVGALSEAAIGRRVKVCLVNDTGNTDNWGARATSSALSGLIEGAGGQVMVRFHESRLTAPQRGDHRMVARGAKALERWVPAGPLPKRISNGLFHRLARRFPDVVPGCWEDFSAKARRVMNNGALEDIRAAMEESDLVVISGEGCIYDNLRQSRMLFFIAYLARCHLGKETVIVNHSADLRHPVLGRIAREVYPLLDDVVFREADSAQECRSFCQPTVGADAAYLYPPAPHREWCRLVGRPGYFDSWPCRASGFDPARPYLCVGGSSSYLRRGGSRGNPVAGYVALCRRLRDVFGQVVLVACTWQDQRFLQTVATELDLPLIGIATSFQQAIDLIGNARAYIGGRWHSAVFAHAGGNPVVALGAHTPKMQAFLNHAGLGGAPIDPFELVGRVPQVVARVRGYLEQGDQLRAQLSESAQDCAANAVLNVRQVARAARTLENRG